MEKLKYLSQRVQIPATTKGFVTVDVTLDKAYDVCDGFQIQYVSDNDTPNDLTLGIQDDSGVINDRVLLKSYVANKSVPFELRYKPYKMIANGRVVRLVFEMLNGTTGLSADLDVYAEFRLKKAVQ